MNRMPERDTFERFLDDWLVAEAGARSPGYLDETMRRIDGVGQRRAWASLERWLPMTLLSARTTVAPPVRLILLLVVGLLAASLATGLAVIGSRVLRPTEPPDLHSGILVPTLQRDDAWSDDPRTDLDEPILGDIGPDGNLYVISGGTNEIVILDPDGHELRRFGGTGREPGRFDFQLAPSDPALKSIGGLAVAADGTIYVADTVNDLVQHVDSEGTVLGTWGGWGPGPGQFLNPIGVDIGPDGSVFVVDDDRNEIQRFRPDGEYLSTIGGPGSNPGQMSYTGFIALGADGTIYNADFGNDRLQSWTSDGSLRWWVGSSGRLPGQFTGPNDVDVDAEGNVYVTDAGRVQVYGSDGVLRSQFGVEGTGVDDGPLFVAIAPDGAAYLSLPAQDQILRAEVIQADQPTGLAIRVPTPARADSSAILATAPAPSLSPAADSPSTRSIGGPFPVPFSVDLPSHWTVQRNDAGHVELGWQEPDRGVGYITLYIPEDVYIDPCHSSLGVIDPPVGPGVEDLTAALTKLPGFMAGPVTDMTFGDRPAKVFDLDNVIDVSQCDSDPWLPQWTWDSGTLRPDSAGPSSGFHQRIAVLDVDGQRVLIDAWPLWGDGAAEVLRVFESIRFPS